jgi:orotate phosphoribosyltransferase
VNDLLLGSTGLRHGHFLFESGHHGDLWLDLDLLCLRPSRLDAPITELSRKLREFRVDIVCGVLSGGAFVGLMVAIRIDAEFCYAERVTLPPTGDAADVRYRIPGAFRRQLSGRRVAIVDDVTNAGSAVRHTYADLLLCGAVPVVIGALAVLGETTQRFTDARGLPLVSVARWPNQLWLPSACPLCASGVPLERPGTANV